MALSAALTDTYATWLIAQRNGGKASGTVYDCLVSDLVVGDYLVGPRCFVATVGATTSGVRAMTFTRLGFTFAANYVAASTVRIIR